MPDKTPVEKSFYKIQELTTRLLTEAKTTDENLAIASNLAYSASVIYELIGGKKLAAAQFYNVADRLAGEMVKPDA